MTWEEEIWKNLVNFLYLDYTIEKIDIVGPTYGYMQHFTDIKIVPERLTNLFCNALKYTEKIRGWKNSFNTAPCKNVEFQINKYLNKIINKEI